MLCLAFPPVGLPLLVFVAIAPWVASLRDTDSRGALKSGALFGALYIAFQMFWVLPFVLDWTHKPVTATIPWLVCIVLGTLIYLPLGWLINQCWKRKWPWLIPLVWAGHEGFRAYMPILAFPWGILANPLWPFPQFVQHAAFGTVFFVSAWLMIPNVAIAMLVWPEKSESGEKLPPGPVMLRMAMLFGGVLMVSAYRYTQMPAGEKKVVTLGQPGVNMAFSDRTQRFLDLASVGKLIQAKAEAQGSDLLVFPEGFAEGDPRVPPYSPVGEVPSVPVVFGGRRTEDGKTYQTAFGYDGQWTSADKTRLVVFGEFVPFRDLPLLKNFNLPSGDLSPAKTLTSIKVNGMTLGPLLCFEGVFPDLAERHSRNGAQVLVQMSIDDWYERTFAWTQLWQSSIWRSIESGLPLVRVGGRGQSLATDARGNVIATVPEGQMAAERVEITVPEKSDAFPYRFAFVWICWAVCGGLWALALKDRFSKKAS